MTNESLPTISQETTEIVTINDKTNPQTSTEKPPSNIITAAPTPAQEEVKQEFSNQNDIVVGLYWKQNLVQVSHSDRKEITSREAVLRK